MKPQLLHSIARIAYVLVVIAAPFGVTKNCAAQSIDLQALKSEVDELAPRCLEAKIADHNSYSLVELPPPITARDIARYSVILKLSEAQQQNLDRLFEQYSDAFKAIMKDAQPELDAAASEMGTDAEQPAEMVQRYEQLQSVIALVNTRMRAAEESLYKSFVDTLAPGQLESMPRVRLHRARQHWFIYAGWLSGSRIDLSDLVDLACRESSVNDAVETLRWEYELARTAATDRLIRHWTENRAAELVAMAHLSAIEAQADGQTDQRLLDAAAAARIERHAILRNAFEIESQIMQVNRRYLPRFLAALPDDCREGFRLRYLMRAYPPEFIEDPDNPAGVIQLVLASNDLPDETRAAIDSQWQSCRARQERILKSLCDEADRWIDRFVELNGTKEADRPAYAAKRFSLLRERLEGNIQCVKATMTLLPSKLSVEFTAKFDEFHAQARRQQELLDRQEAREREMARILKEIGD